MDNLTTQALLDFLSELGKHVSSPTRLLLLGGSALNLLGNPRPTLDIDYLGDDLNKTDFQLTIDQIAAQHRLYVEAIPFYHFIPIPEDSDRRHIFYKRFGQLDVYIFDPYAIALAKIDRGFDTDIDDVLFLVRQSLVDILRLRKMLEIALERAVEFDLHPVQARQRIKYIQEALGS
ncbi:MAG: hypothetical protein JXB15_02170 [Anaerolineales bacterium]|nr:hypothetical protein [Anaerolineales bacterium]